MAQAGQLPDKSLRHVVAARLRAEITASSRPGDRLEAEATLSRRFGVNIAKIREGLILLEQEGLVERRHGSGTFVTDPLKTRPVGLFCNMDLTHPGTGLFFRVLVHELRWFFRSRGVHTQLYLGYSAPGSDSPDVDCPELFRALARHQLSGLMVLTSPTDVDVLQRWFGALTVPVVGRNSFFPFSYCFPTQQMLTAGLHRLVELGCRRLAFIGWNSSDRPPAPLNRVLEREREYLNTYAVTVQPDWIRMDLYPNLPGAGWDDVREVWRLGSANPDGLLICDDCLLADAAQALRQLGIRIPGDLQVVGFTNRGISHAVPFPMTRIELDPQRIACSMADMLLRQVAGQRIADPHRFDEFTVVPPPADVPTDRMPTPAGAVQAANSG